MSAAEMERPDVPEEVLTAIDLGTTKVTVLLGLAREGAVSAIGFGTAPSHGLMKGTVVDIETTVEAITRAVREAEAQAGVQAGLAFATIGGNHIHSASSQAMATIANREHGITEEDFQRVLEQAQNISLPSDHEILHAIVQEFSVDNQDGIRNPVGMYGNKLEARVRIVTGAITCIQNVIRSVQRSGLACGGVILQALAAERAVLTPEERELGAVALDLGGGTTDMAVITGKALRHTAVVTLGGNQITKDIAFGLRIPFGSAEELKRAAGCCLVSEIRDDEAAQLPAVGGRQPRTVPRRAVARIIEPRIEEMLGMVRDELRSAGCPEESLGGGVVLTGGCAHLPFLVEKAEQVFEQLSARVGEPVQLPGAPDTLRKPEHACAVGLLLLAAEQRRHAVPRRRAPLFGGMSKWFKGLIKDS
jgi:cell division protein FtsA